MPEAGFDCEYGHAAGDIVAWLRDGGYLREGDCAMDVACGRGGMAYPMSRTVRILVCMDTSRESLDITGARCEGGCPVELFEQDWNTYVPSRGKYDACVMSPSYLCFNEDSIRRMETVSRRSCAVVFPTVFDYRRIRKAFLQSLGVRFGFLAMPNFPDSRPFMSWLSESDRRYEVRSFETSVDCPEERFRRSIVRDSVLRGADRTAAEAMATKYVEGVAKDGHVRYRFSATVLAWDVEPERAGRGWNGQARSPGTGPATFHLEARGSRQMRVFRTGLTGYPFRPVHVHALEKGSRWLSRISSSRRTCRRCSRPGTPAPPRTWGRGS